MNYLLLITALSLNRANLTIYYNPATEHGQAVYRQLNTDMFNIVRTWPVRERLLAQNAVIEHEFDRRRINKYFNITWIESSDQLSFRINSGNLVVIPSAKMADPREYPGYITFFSYVVDTYYEDYFTDLSRAENDRRWRRWHIKRSAMYADFILRMIEKKYEHYFNECDIEYSENFFKDGQFFTAERLGWVEPEPPILIPNLIPKICPLDPNWRLPK